MADASTSAAGASPAERLTAPAFVAAVARRAANDWVFKAAAPNWLTGKLSDVAGLFAFALFWTALVPRRRALVFALTAAAFVLWKSPASEAPLAAWNALGVWPLARVVDYSDWLALGALVPAYRAAGRAAAARPARAAHAASHLLRRAAAAAVGVASVVTFGATSRAPRYALGPGSTPAALDAERIAGPPRDVARGLQAIGLYIVYPPARATPRDTGPDTLTVYIRQPPERDVAVSLELREVAPDTTQLRPLFVSAPGPRPQPEAVRRAFAAQLVAPLRRWAAARGAGR